MMLDEPYRWAEAVANRRDYVEDQLQTGSPLVGLTYCDGMLLVTLGRGQQKVFEVYDRIAMAAVGHPTDIEKLRHAAIDLAHVMGFNYSKLDVTLQQIVHFGLGPAMKTSFDDIIRSPFVARLLLAEVGDEGGASTFYAVDYDGTFHKATGAAGLGGVPDADRLIAEDLGDAPDPDRSLTQAVRDGLHAWAVGRWAGDLPEMPHEAGALDEALAEADISALLKRELGSLTPEVVVLDRSSRGPNAFRRLPDDEVDAMISELRS